MIENTCGQLGDFVAKHVGERDVIGFAIAVHFANGAATWEQETGDPKRMAEVLGSVLDDVNRLRLANLEREAAALGFDLVARDGP